MLKHIGRVKSTGHRCIVVFRELHDKEGNVTDQNRCIVFSTENLQPTEHDDLIRIVESEPAQSTGDFYTVLAREKLTNGFGALHWLGASGRLLQYETNDVELTPNHQTVIGLDELNDIIRHQQAGRSEEEIRNMLQDDTDKPPRPIDTQTTVIDQINERMANDDIRNQVPVEATEEAIIAENEQVIDDSTLAQRLLDEAETMAEQIVKLRNEAVELDNSMNKPFKTMIHQNSCHEKRGKHGHSTT